MRTNESGIRLIKAFEGLRLKAYKCPAGIWTIGYGHTLNVFPGQVITEQEADILLKMDIQLCEKIITPFIKVQVNDNQFSALISFAYNIGPGNPKAIFKKGGFYWSKVLKELNAGNYEAAADAFLLYNKARDPETKKLIELSGLTKRRKAERELFLTKEAVPQYYEIPELPVADLEMIPFSEHKLTIDTLKYHDLA